MTRQGGPRIRPSGRAPGPAQLGDSATTESQNDPSVHSWEVQVEEDQVGARRRCMFPTPPEVLHRLDAVLHDDEPERIVQPYRADPLPRVWEE